MGATKNDYLPPQNKNQTPQQQIDSIYRLVAQLWAKVTTISAALDKLKENYGTLSSKRIVELIQTVQTEVIDATAEDPMYQSLIDDAGGGVTYVGEAAQGAAQNSASWRILKVSTATGDSTIQLSPNYATMADNWTNRASLTYT